MNNELLGYQTIISSQTESYSPKFEIGQNFNTAYAIATIQTTMVILQQDTTLKNVLDKIIS